MVELSSIVVSSRSVEEWLEKVCSYGPQRLEARTICCTIKFFLPVPVLFGCPLVGRVDIETSSSGAGDALGHTFELLTGVVSLVAGVCVAVKSTASVTWASSLVVG